MSKVAELVRDVSRHGVLVFGDLVTDDAAPLSRAWGCTDLQAHSED